ncbi:hypothetical protein ABTN31_19660, partial [Acinetobacter baumannii]
GRSDKESRCGKIEGGRALQNADIHEAGLPVRGVPGVFKIDAERAPFVQEKPLIVANSTILCHKPNLRRPAD